MKHLQEDDQQIAEELEVAGIHEQDEVELTDEDLDAVLGDGISEDDIRHDANLYEEEEGDPVEEPTNSDEIDDLDDDDTIDEEDDETIGESRRMWIRAANFEDRFREDK